MRTLFIDGNSWVIKREEIRDHTGSTPAGLTARCFLAEGEVVDGVLTVEDTAIHPSLEVANASVVGSTVAAIISGSSLATHLEPLLAAAELAGEPLDIYDRVIIAGSYSDYERVRVERYRPAGIS